MHKKLYISLIFCNLVVLKSLSTHIIVMHNFVTKFRKILEICKQFAGNLVNEKGNVPRCGVVPIFSDIEVIALSFTAEAFSIDSENCLFNRLEKECPDAIANLVSRRQFNNRRKLTSSLGETIRQRIAKAIDGGESVFSIDSKPVKVCRNARAGRCAMGRTDTRRTPAWGYCASQKMALLWIQAPRPVWYQRGYTLLRHDGGQRTRPALSQGHQVGIPRLHGYGRQGVSECSCTTRPL